MSKELVPRGTEVEVIEVVDGELVDVVDCWRCGGRHGVSLGTMRCCCGEEHSPEICCACGHFHEGGPCPSTPCGDYRCCIN